MRNNNICPITKKLQEIVYGNPVITMLDLRNIQANRRELIDSSRVGYHQYMKVFNTNFYSRKHTNISWYSIANLMIVIRIKEIVIGQRNCV